MIGYVIRNGMDNKLAAANSRGMMISYNKYTYKTISVHVFINQKEANALKVRLNHIQKNEIGVKRWRVEKIRLTGAL